MKILFKFGQELLWTAFWVFVVLILGFAFLSWASNKFSGNVVGSSASWVEQHASPS